MRSMARKTSGSDSFSASSKCMAVRNVGECGSPSWYRVASLGCAQVDGVGLVPARPIPARSRQPGPGLVPACLRQPRRVPAHLAPRAPRPSARGATMSP